MPTRWGIGEAETDLDGDWASDPDPDRRDYASFADFADPDGNTWTLREIGHRQPEGAGDEGGVRCSDSTTTPVAHVGVLCMGAELH